LLLGTFKKTFVKINFLFAYFWVFVLFVQENLFVHAVTKNIQVRAYTAKHNGKIEWAHRAWMKSKERAAFLAARKGEQL
jgi:hypothetical protein